MDVEIKLKLSHQHIPRGGLLQLLEEERYTDMTFCVSGARVRAHRAIVASQSEYFDRLLYGSMKEASAAEVTLEDTPETAFRVLLRYMYSGMVTTTVTVESALDLLCLADKYGFQCLHESLALGLCDVADLSNVLQLFFSAEASNSPMLHQHCESLIDANAQALLAGDVILSLSWESLKYLITRDSFVVDEIHIFHAVCRWKEKNEASNKELAELLSTVRVSEIPMREVVNVVSPTGMYTTSSLYALVESQRKQPLSCFPSTRGRLPDGNLLTSKRTQLKDYSNFNVEKLPNHPRGGPITTLSFKLAYKAAEAPSAIVLQLDDLYVINELKFEGYPGISMTEEEEEEQGAGDQQPYCYRVEVAKELPHWVAVVDYSNLKCCSTQQLYFPKQAVRFVRLVLTRGRQMYIIHFSSCSYNPEALTKYKFREIGLLAPLNPIEPEYSQYVARSTDQLRCFVTFSQPYSISQLRFHICGVEGAIRVRVDISVSTQNKQRCYKEVAKLESHLLSAPVLVSFSERPVSIVSITVNWFLDADGRFLGYEDQPTHLVKGFTCQAVEIQRPPGTRKR